MLDLKLLGNRIKQLRNQRGLTQSAFAERLGVSFQAVSNWERGIAPPDLENLNGIADFFGVLIDDIVHPKSEELFLGIDGGGTKTEFTVVTSDGYVLKRFVKGGCNPNDGGYQKTAAVISSGIDEALIEFGSVRAIFCGIAGVSTGDHKKRLTAELKRRYPQIDTQIANDAVNLFSIDDSAEMAVISGTGSVVFVKQGEEFKRLGGWGYLIDDSGSAFEIGKSALREALRQDDMLEEPSVLNRLLRQKLGVEAVWEHISTVYGEGKPYIASLASVVFEAYGLGDRCAEKIIDNSAKSLADWLNAGVSLYGAKPIAIANGGIFEHYGDIMTRHISKYSSVRIIPAELPPIFGACKRACALGGCITDGEFYENFKKTYGGTK